MYEKIWLTENELHTVRCALEYARSGYIESAKNARKTNLLRLAEQFERQARDCDELLSTKLDI